MHRFRWLRLAALALIGIAPGISAQGRMAPAEIDHAAGREQALVRLVRQDCGSCHGMRLTGGLGPALTRDALADKPVAGLAATIFQGRPGTPMPGWRSMLSEAESLWIAQQLMQGFPEERRAQR
ncbi:MAG: cytochrome c [Burkholderiaceae bacterium]